MSFSHESELHERLSTILRATPPQSWRPPDNQTSRLSRRFSAACYASYRNRSAQSGGYDMVSPLREAGSVLGDLQAPEEFLKRCLEVGMCIAISFLGAVFFYVWIERPILEFLTVFVQSRLRFVLLKPACQRIGADQKRPIEPRCGSLLHGFLQPLNGVVVIFGGSLLWSTRGCRHSKICAPHGKISAEVRVARAEIDRSRRRRRRLFCPPEKNQFIGFLCPSRRKIGIELQRLIERVESTLVIPFDPANPTFHEMRERDRAIGFPPARPAPRWRRSNF